MDICDRNIAAELLSDPFLSDSFQVHPVRSKNVTEMQWQYDKLKNFFRGKPSLNMWAYWVIHSKLFKRIILVLIFLDIVALAIQAEVFDHEEENLQVMMDAVKFVDLFCLCCFIAEIILKMLDNFYLFWKSNWNIFDFIITTLSVLPEIINSLPEMTNSHKLSGKIFQAIRILRCLKILSNFQKARIVILAVTKAMKSMVYILLLLLIFAFIFAVCGITMFQALTHSYRGDLIYKEYFKDLPNAFVTLFILFTNDHWTSLLLELWKVPEVNKFFSTTYIILWIFIASFMFRNIFVGVMVDKFQEIHHKLAQEVKKLQKENKKDMFKAQIINRRLNKMTTHKQNLLSSSTESAPMKKIKCQNEMNELDIEWESYICKKLHLLKDQDENEPVAWPKDSLFRYFELVGKLQDNLEERKILQNTAAQLLLSLHASKNIH
ncbi:cation channel sperm-associated protein 2 [Protopterus annectens]|uniref:cation channel sperm-associated protein 2 n=1 Tax=Protopterus annectens TaxID=7888 RepID=UPI001CFB409F|nr:cation channel sperm-associated protein 2 [Protopterus annectens]